MTSSVRITGEVRRAKIPQVTDINHQVTQLGANEESRKIVKKKKMTQLKDIEMLRVK